MSSRDERIVELEFDNKSFEAGVSNTLKSLETLKNSLNFDGTSKGLNNLEKSINSMDFSNLEAGIQNIGNRFSTLGIAGMTVIQDLTSTVMNAGKKLVSSTFGQVLTGGYSRASNIEQAKFQLNGLGVAWKDIGNDIDYAVSGTAYGLDQAAVAASQLISSGVEVGDSMKAALRGISGVAAMTNRDYSEIARVFTNVAGRGKVMGDTLNEIGARGVNAAATITNFMNDVNSGSVKASKSVEKTVKEITNGVAITESDLRDLVSKGKIDFALFSEAMDSAFGEHAKDANNTLTGVLSNIRSALSRIGADFISPLIENKGPVVSVLNVVRDKIDEVRNAIHDFFGWKTDLETGDTYLLSWTNLVVSTLDKVQRKLESIETSKIAEVVTKALTIITNLGKTAWNILDSMAGVVQIIWNAFRTIFPQSFVDIIIKITDSLSNFFQNIRNGIWWFNKMGQDASKVTERFRGIANVLDKVHRIFKGFFALVDIAWQIVKPLATTLWNLVKGPLGSIADFLLSGLANIGDFLVRVDDAIKKSGIITGVFQAIQKTLSPIAQLISKIVDSVKEFFEAIFNVNFGGFTTFLDNWKNRFKAVSDGIDGTTGKLSILGSILDKIKTLGEKFFNVMKKMGSGIANTLGKALDKLAELNFDGIIDLLNGGAIFALANGFGKLTKSLAGIGTSMLSGNFNALKAFAPTLNGMLSDLRLNLNMFAKKVESEALQKVAVAIAILAAACIALSFVDSGKLAVTLGIVTGLLADLMGTLKIFSSTTGPLGFLDTLSKTRQMDSMASSLIKISAALLILSFALMNLAKIPFTDLVKGLAAVTAILTIFVVYMEAVSSMQVNSAKLGAASVSMIIVSTAMLIFAKALSKFENISWESVAKGLISLVSIVGTLVILSDNALAVGKMLVMALALIPVGIALATFAASLYIFNFVEWESIKKGLVGLGAVLLEIAAVSWLINPFSIIPVALGLIPMGLALAELAGVFMAFAYVKWSAIEKGVNGLGRVLAEIALFSDFTWGGRLQKNAKGMVVMGAALAEIAGVFKAFDYINVNSIGKGLYVINEVLDKIQMWSFLTGGNKLVRQAKALVIMGGALAIFIGDLKAFEKIDDSAIQKGLTAIGIILAELAVFSLVTGSFKIMALAGGLTALSFAFQSFSKVLRLFENISWASIAKGLVALGGALGMFVIGVTVLASLSKALEGFYFSMFKLASISVLLGAGMALAGWGLATFAGALLAIAASGSTVLRIILSLIDSLVERIPQIAKKAAEGIIEFIKTIGDGIPIIIDSLVKIIEAALDAIQQTLPDIVDTVLSIILQLLDTLVEYIPTIVDKLVTLIIKLFDALTAKIPELVRAASDFISALFGAILDSIKGRENEFVAAVSSIVGAVLVFSKIPITGVLRAAASIGILTGALTAITVALGLLMKIPGFKQILQDGGEALKLLGQAIGGFIGGIYGGILEGVSNAFPSIGSNLSAFATNATAFFNLISSLDKRAIDGAKAIAEVVLALTVADLITGIETFLGMKSSFSEFGNQLSLFADGLVGFAKKVSELSNDELDSIAKAADASKTLAEIHPPNEGGFISWIVGENKLDTFGEHVESYGKSLVSFAKAIREINKDDIDKIDAVAAASTSLTQIHPPNEGGFISWIVGENNLDTFGEHLKSYGSSLSSFADSIKDIDQNDIDLMKKVADVSNILTEISPPNEGGFINWIIGESKLTDFGANLEVYGNSLKKFSDSISGIPADTLNTIGKVAAMSKKLAEVCSAIDGVDFVVFGNFTSDSLAMFGRNLEAYGDSINVFAGKVSQIPSNAIAQIEKVAGISISLSNIVSNLKGSSQWSTSNLKTFSDDLPVYGEAIMSFSKNISGFDSTMMNSVKYIATASGYIKRFLDNAPDTSGEVEFFTGSVTMGDFAEGLITFGECIISFGTSMTGLTSGMIDGIANAATASQYIKDILSSLGDDAKTGGIKQLFEGYTSLESFSSEMEAYGSAIFNFGEKVKTLDENHIKGITNAVDATKNLSQLSEITKGFGLKSIFEGFSSTDSIVSNLSAYGEGLSGFANAIVDLNLGQEVYLAAKRTIDLLTDMQKVDGSATVGFSMALQNIGKAGVSGFLQAFQDTATVLQPTIHLFLEAAVQYIKNGETAFNESGGQLANAVAKGFSSKQRAVVQAIQLVITAVIVKLSSFNSMFRTKGEAHMSQYISGLNLKGGEAATTASAIGSRVQTAFAASINMSKFYSLGIDCMTGFMLGMQFKALAVYAAAYKIGKDTVDATKRAVNSNSPSKEFFRIGQYNDQGLINGTLSMQKEVSGAYTSIGNSSIAAMRSSIAKINDYISEGIDPDPVIRPVMDLSNVNEGIGILSELLNGTSLSGIGTTRMMAASIATGYRGTKTASSSAKPSAGPTYNYTQNISSPKSLSEYEVYRQTRNLLNIRRRGVN
ncbi:MAG: hypothetical protein IJJ10_03300 [Bacillus sp. (in: Bacteria)]|nr:hypothetical protein [Bacillus sp. (in: firmicutes)]